MTTVPLPDVPCVRVKLDYTLADSQLAGSRFYLSYSGSAPSGANCITLATDIAANWAAHIAAMCTVNWTLTEVDVIDIATATGASGTVAVSNAGSRSGTQLPQNISSNVEFDIARRYRGGKPRMFFPPGVNGDLQTDATWNSSYISAMNSAVTAFFGAVISNSVGSMGTLAHVNLSYFHGFTNLANSSGRVRAVPTYKATATHDDVVGYATKALISTQNRRRKSSTY